MRKATKRDRYFGGESAFPLSLFTLLYYWCNSKALPRNLHSKKHPVSYKNGRTGCKRWVCFQYFVINKLRTNLARSLWLSLPS